MVLDVPRLVILCRAEAVWMRIVSQELMVDETSSVMVGVGKHLLGPGEKRRWLPKRPANSLIVVGFVDKAFPVCSDLAVLLLVS
jgi:hypothetical protein